jgi:hypothetical protein
MTISKSKKFPTKAKQKILEASEGKVKAIVATLTDAEGNEVVLKGELYESKNGGLTARFNARVNSFEIIEVDEEEAERGMPEAVVDGCLG